MRNLTALLKNGEISPRDRVLLSAHDSVMESKTGKGILSESEKHALGRGWKPKNNFEISEYNNYNEGWKTACWAGVDMSIASLMAQNSLLRASRIADHAMYPGTDNLEFFMKREIEKNGKEAEMFIYKNSGILYDGLIHRLTFDGLDKQTREDILALDPSAETERQYLEQEEILADAFHWENSLSNEAKRELVDKIVETIRCRYALSLNEKGLSAKEWNFDTYFGELPAMDILLRWASENGVPEDDDLTTRFIETTERKGQTIRVELIDIILKWMNEGLFEKEYVPIFKSRDKSTCNDKDTKCSHKEVFKKWIAGKRKAEELIRGLCATGELVRETRIKMIFNFEESVEVITGESLARCAHPFALEYGTQVNKLIPLGCLFLFLKSRSFMREYANLLDFQDILKKLSILYETDLSWKSEFQVKEFKEMIEQLNYEMAYVVEQYLDVARSKTASNYPFEFFVKGVMFSADIEPEESEATAHYRKELKGLNIGF